MKRFLTSLATFSLVETIGRHPAIAGALMLLGVGGGAGIATLLTPAIIPQSSAYFNSNQSFGNTNNALRTNNGSNGPFEPPATTPNSFVIYVEGLIDPNLGNNSDGSEYVLGTGGANQFLLLSDNNAGQPAFFVQKLPPATAGSQWWNAVSSNTLDSSAAASGTLTSYNTGYYPFTATGGGCAREPTGVWFGGSTVVQIVDPGFNCSTAPTVNPVTIPGDGAQQATGAGSAATACTSNYPVSGNFAVTAHVAVAHGIVPGQTYSMQGFTPTGYNVSYTALPGTTGTTLVGTPSTATTGTCPAAVSVEGTALSGTTAAITMPAISTTTPFQAAGGQTGITTHNAQHFCGIIGENGADSPFPGAPFASFVDEKGNPLPGAPALVPWLNQGTVNFTGYTLANTQSPASPALTVTAMNPYTITAATYSGTTGYVTFTTSTSPGFIPGSEFTVSGISPSGYNQTYVAVAGTSGTTVVGNPLSGPVGTPLAIAAPAAYSSGGSMVSVITPGMQVLGETAGEVISPYGTFGGTGSGGVGTYGLVGNQSTFTFTGSISGTTLTLGSTPAPLLVVGQALTSSTGGSLTPTTITGLLTGSGSSGSTYSIANSQTVASGTITASGAIGSSGSPVTIFAYPSFYYSAVPSTVPAGGVTTARTQSNLGDFFSIIAANLITTGTYHSGWGGALGNLAMLYGVFPQTTGAMPSTSALAFLCKKTTTIPAFAAANGLTVHSYYPLNDTGIWADAGGAQFTGSISGTALTVASVQNGALSTGQTIAGAGISGCPSTCPTLSSGSGSSWTLSASGGTVASEPVTAGAFKPAAPIASNVFNGYISGNTLTVTSIGTTSGYASFTGSLSGTTLTVSGVTGALANGMTITDGGVNLTGPPLLTVGSGSSTWPVLGNYYTAGGATVPPSGTETMYGTLSALVPGQYVFNAGIATPVKIVGYGTLSPCPTTGLPWLRNLHAVQQRERFGRLVGHARGVHVHEHFGRRRSRSGTGAHYS